jgi:two-component system sensor histidine kinase RegB
MVFMHPSENTAPSASLASRGDWVRLRTLLALRWLAIAGQLIAIGVGWRFFGIAIDALPVLSVIAIAVAANLVSALVFPQNRRLSEAEALAVLAFDSCQLAALLYLTGGLNNPFALLLLAPATVSAAALNDLSTAAIGALTIILVTILAWFHVPLRFVGGTVIAMPGILGFGFWLAIVIGVIFLGLYARRVSAELHAMSDALLATQMALAREQKLTDLSGVVAAAAHELGTPLATIKLVSSELADELAGQPELLADAELIGTQADRCRDILRSMGRAGKDDLHMRAAPFQAVVEEAAEPHRHRNATLIIQPSGTGGQQPLILRRPEIIHGLRNLIQNAVDFAHAAVWIDLHWDAEVILLTITDDGPGFPPQLIGRIGDPFMRSRARPEGTDPARAHYEGMGMGLFIAKTLLERTGARLSFSNASDPFLAEDERLAQSGARVEVMWPRDRVAADASTLSGQNQPLAF